MKKYLLVLSILVYFIPFSKAVNVTVIESQLGNPGHVMDTMWLTVCTNLGFTTTIGPQTTLDNNAFFSTTDILIVSSGIINLPPNRVNTILQFLQQGGDVYLQAEYLPSYTTNQAFVDLVTALGGGFSWITSVSGDLQPMSVLGSLSNTPNVISPLGYFWYGVSGSPCSNVEPFLQYQGDYFGYIFCPGSTGIGRLICTTDQDWIRTATLNDQNLMANILNNLTDSTFQCNAIGFPLLNLGFDSIICLGDTLNLHAGTGFNSYLWQDGSTDSVFQVTLAGTYYVTVVTPCNSYTDTVIVGTIACNAVPVVALLSSDTVFCDKKCLDFTDLSTNNPTSWQWIFSGAVPGTSSDQNPVNVCYNAYGSFDVTLIACNAAGCDTLFLPSFITEYQIPQQPVLTLSNDTLYCFPQASVYSWYNTNNPGTIISTAPFIVTSLGESYFVIVGDSLGCQNSSTVFDITKVNEYEQVGSCFSLLPNVLGETATIKFNSENFNPQWEVQINDVTGNLVFLTKIYGQQQNITLTNLSSGIYFVLIKEKGRIICSQKFCKIK